MRCFLYFLIAIAIFVGCKKDTPDPPIDTTSTSSDVPCYNVAHVRFIVDSCKFNNPIVSLDHHSYIDYITFLDDGSFNFQLEILPDYTSTCPDQRVEAVYGSGVIAKYLVQFNKGEKTTVTGKITGKKGQQIEFQMSGNGKSHINPYSWIIINLAP